MCYKLNSAIHEQWPKIFLYDNGQGLQDQLLEKYDKNYEVLIDMLYVLRIDFISDKVYLFSLYEINFISIVSIQSIMRSVHGLNDLITDWIETP